MELKDVQDYLPEVVLEMVELIGFVDTEKLINAFGGTTFRFTDGQYYFPKLVEAVGRESAVALRKYFNIEQVYIPRCEVALRLLRNYRFKADFDWLTESNGKSGRLAMLELCPKYGVSDRAGWDILRKMSSATTNQSALF
ncbi:mor transcription activator family protein [Pasteurellaceae bacterium HPA106]|uniref:Mor transcription activator family protein n=1 Tax=Spirabiliibacterium pneumoniae TaxID=221400 RepID=UPI001AAC7C79|nr:Mor transcription activator family protein [Spirabiliibacterium pneumoniae]MBE2895474.1 mor transcription activator family protein [Spirabiliibacterium pneumoniae]